MIPVYFKTARLSEPPSPLYYLVAANGTFVVKKTPVFSSVTRARVPPWTGHQEELLRLHIPKLPADEMGRIWGFFREVFDRWKGEAVVFLYYAPKTRTFRVSPPSQTLYRHWYDGRWRTEMRVRYGFLPRGPGLLKIGDVHSHCHLPAFHSCVDDFDEKEDGLHVVMGNIQRAQPDLKVSFMANGTRFPLESGKAFEAFHEALPPPMDWIERVKCEKA